MVSVVLYELCFLFTSFFFFCPGHAIFFFAKKQKTARDCLDKLEKGSQGKGRKRDKFDNPRHGSQEIAHKMAHEKMREKQREREGERESGNSLSVSAADNTNILSL